MLFLFSTVFVRLNAEDIVVDGISYDVDLETMEAKVVAGDYAFRDIVIPESFTYNGKTLTVTTLGEGAFFCNFPAEKSPAYATSIVIPQSIVSIEKQCFANTNYLKKIVIPKSVQKIGSRNWFTAKDSIIFEDGEIPITYYRGNDVAYGYIQAKYVYQGRDFKDYDTEFFFYYGLCKSHDVEIFECGDYVKYPFNLSYQISVTFSYCPYDLKTIILGRNIDEMVDGSQIEGLESIYSKSENPRGYYDETPHFTNSQYMNVVLYVPLGCKSKYENAEGWKKFFKIVEMDFSTSVVPADIVHKQDLYDVYSLDGKPILKGAQDLNSLQNGIYIINGKKMLIKK